MIGLLSLLPEWLTDRPNASYTLWFFIKQTIGLMCVFPIANIYLIQALEKGEKINGYSVLGIFVILSPVFAFLAILSHMNDVLSTLFGLINLVIVGVAIYVIKLKGPPINRL